ncbi:MAG: 2TM domain-containing protein [Ginsengibacter sp.]
MDSNTNSQTNISSANEQKDPVIWKTAQKRASFKYHALIYFIMNIFFWTLWYISLQNGNDNLNDRSGIPWPVWPMFGWGIGLLFHYLGAFHNTNRLAEREYEKLKKNNY